MNILRYTTIAASLAVPMAVGAHDYSYVEGGYVSVDRGRDEDGGLRIAGSVPFTAAANGFAEFSDTGDFQQLSIGGQWHTQIATHLDFTAGASLEYVDSGPADDTGLGLRAGLRWLSPNGRFEVNPEIRSVEVFDDRATSLHVAGLAALSPTISAIAAVQGGDDGRVELGLRAYF